MLRGGDEMHSDIRMLHSVMLSNLSWYALFRSRQTYGVDDLYAGTFSASTDAGAPDSIS